VIPLTSPLVDERDSNTVLEQVENRRPAYVPAWNPPERSAGAALSQIYSRLLEAVLERLNQVRARDKLAFLDLLGFRLTPAQSSRAPIVFKLSDGAPDSSAPKATQVAAPPPPGGSQQIVFETEEDIGVASAKLTQIVSLWPGRDQFIDHSVAYKAATPFVLFQGLQLQPIPHVLYLAHGALLALAGKVHLEVAFDLAQGSSSPLDVIWEFWDSQVWRQFKTFQPSCLEAAEAGHDGTLGFTRDGSVRLDADAAQTAQTSVNGLQSYWIRGRLDQSLPPNPAQLLPLADTIRVRTLIDQGLEMKVSVSCANPAPVGSLTIVDEDGQNLSAFATVRLTQADDPSVVFDSTNVQGWQFTTGKTYQVVVTYQTDPATQGMIGNAFALYNLETSTAAVTIVLKVLGLLPDKALSGGKNVDVTKSFFPLGQSPVPGSALYFKQAEIFSKPGARVTLYVACASPPSSPIDHTLNWEYWNGDEWAVLAQSTDAPSMDFTATEIIEFNVPNDMRSSKVNNEDGYWIRVRMVSGGYGSKQTITFPSGTLPPSVTFTQLQSPIVNRFCFGYSWVRGPEALESVLTYNDFAFTDQTNNARWPGTKFGLFQPTDEVTPALYLGFDRTLLVNNFGMYFDILEQNAADSGPDLAWEYWNGAGWHKLVAEDETQRLELPGIVTVLAEADSRALSRFGQPLFWIRARLKEDAPPNQTTINNIFPNTVWASQLRTSLNQPLGASDGSPNQMLRFTQIPVLPGQIVAVQELSGPRANTEWRLAALDVSGGDPSIVTELEALLAGEGTQTDVFSANGRIDLKRDKRKIVTEVWVTWTEQDNFFDSGPGDRHYVLDHATGRLFFGDGNAGKIPPAGADIQASLFRSGGGLAGNVAAGTITQLLGAVSGIQGVTNPRAAEGGADGETLEEFAQRAPQGIRNRDRAISLADYENLAREASAGVAVARAIPTRDPNGVTLAGWVTLVIIPHSLEPRPMPSFGLREDVRSYLEQHAPGDVAQAHRIRVIGPSYLPIDVAATLAPKDVSQAGTVEQAARDALETFLHPLYGGPAGRGWTLGRNVFLSDVASVLGGTAGVDFVSELFLSVNGVLQDEEVIVPHDQIVVAGELSINLTVAV
jgi:uncharacterized phage protein gp47/JayE